jgi:hypothetical protein
MPRYQSRHERGPRHLAAASRQGRRARHSRRSRPTTSRLPSRKASFLFLACAMAVTATLLSLPNQNAMVGATPSAARDVCTRKPDLRKCPTGTSMPTASSTPTSQTTVPTTTAPSTSSPAPTLTSVISPTSMTTPPPTSIAPAGIGVPPEITSNCSADVTSALLTWIRSVPDGATLSFGAAKCYRIDGTLEIRGRRGLMFDGNGSAFRSYSAPADQRAVWRAIDSAGLVFRNMTIIGSYASGGTFTASLQHAHGIDLRGTSAVVSGVNVSDVAGDCVYFGLGYSSLTRSSGAVRDSVCQRTSRNGVAVAAGDDIRIERNKFDLIGLIGVDIEPNQGAGWGSQRVGVDSNTIGRYRLYAYAIVLNAPLYQQTFTHNRVVGRGLRIGLVDPGRTAYRAADVTISGNVADTAQFGPAVEAYSIDGLTVTDNTVPLSSGPLAAVSDSCHVTVSGNSYSGGTAEATIIQPSC